MNNNFKLWESKFKESWFSVKPGVNGFLPVGSPLDKLPEKYEKLEEILNKMKIVQKDGKNGYIYNNELKDIVDSDLPFYDVNEETDKQLVAGLFRDFCFLAAAYSLESSHSTIVDEKTYAKAVDIIPAKIAEPLLVLSEKVGVYPWLDYAHGYGLNNAVFVGDNKKDHKCYKTVRTFNGCDSEEGFINVHVAMVAQTGELLKHQQDILYNISVNDRTKFNEALNEHYNIFSNIIETLQTMWKASNYNDYLSFRTFIMGQKGNDLCYPDENLKFHRKNGTVELHSYRGETGAQDSIIPSIDNLFQLKYPRNKLTEYLYDLRSYRPKDHQEYINYCGFYSDELGFKDYVYDNTKSCILVLKNLNCLRMFRKKHWNLTKKYIIENTKHPVATGGTPITTWLPNQLGATLEYMSNIVDLLNERNDIGEDMEFFTNIKLELSDHIQSIMDEVKSLQNNFDDQIHDEYLKR